MSALQELEEAEKSILCNEFGSSGNGDKRCKPVADDAAQPRRAKRKASKKATEVKCADSHPQLQFSCCSHCFSFFPFFFDDIGPLCVLF